MSVVSIQGSVFQAANPPAVQPSAVVNSKTDRVKPPPVALDDDSEIEDAPETDDPEKESGDPVDDGFGQDDETETEDGFKDGLDDDDELDEFDDIDEDDFDDDFDDDFEEELNDDYEIAIDDDISAEFGLSVSDGDDEIDDGLDDFDDFDSVQ